MEVPVTKSNFYQTTGTEFYSAFRKLLGGFSSTDFDFMKFGQILKPCYYCAALSLELFLKSYLENKGIHSGTDHKSHNLVRLINLDKTGITSELKLDSIDIKNIKILNKKYFGEEYLRYDSKGGPHQFPNPFYLDKIIIKVEKNLQEILLKDYLDRSGATTVI